jgi:hypothetical protein
MRTRLHVASESGVTAIDLVASNETCVDSRYYKEYIRSVESFSPLVASLQIG